MKIKWKKVRVSRAKGPFIYLSDQGPFQWNTVGSVVEVPDAVGYKLLERDGDIVERVDYIESEVRQVVKRKVSKSKNEEKRIKSVQDKMQRKIEDK